jgi:hypothetical protein
MSTIPCLSPSPARQRSKRSTHDSGSFSRRKWISPAGSTSRVHTRFPDRAARPRPRSADSDEADGAIAFHNCAFASASLAPVLTWRIGKPSLQSVGSGFPAITRPLPKLDYFSSAQPAHRRLTQRRTT